MFADTIFQSLLPLVECLCKQINNTFQQLKSIYARDHTQSNISPESTLISLMNGLEQILAQAHDRLTTQETKTSASKSPEQPHGFFSNVVSGVFATETSHGVVTGKARTHKTLVQHHPLHTRLYVCATELAAP
jgi:hypothetical protein